MIVVFFLFFSSNLDESEKKKKRDETRREKNRRQPKENKKHIQFSRLSPALKRRGARCPLSLFVFFQLAIYLYLERDALVLIARSITQKIQ